jgi:Putative peptidoglycan binding domain.
MDPAFPPPVGIAEQAANNSASTAGPDSVLRAQVQLLRAHFSTGEIDGKEGMNVEKAVRAFQADRGIESHRETG